MIRKNHCTNRGNEEKLLKEVGGKGGLELG